METVIQNSKSDQVTDSNYSCECARGEKKVVKEITIAYDIQFKIEMATTLGVPASNTSFSELENKQILLFKGENIKHKTISFECCE